MNIVRFEDIFFAVMNIIKVKNLVDTVFERVNLTMYDLTCPAKWHNVLSHPGHPSEWSVTIIALACVFFRQCTIIVR